MSDAPVKVGERYVFRRRICIVSAIEAETSRDGSPTVQWRVPGNNNLVSYTPLWRFALYAKPAATVPQTRNE